MKSIILNPYNKGAKVRAGKCVSSCKCNAPAGGGCCRSK